MESSVFAILPGVAPCILAARTAFGADRVKTANGIVESTAAPKDGVRSLQGHPVRPAAGGRPALARAAAREELDRRPQRRHSSAPPCMQRLSPSADYWFRSDGMSEDCLYLNVWTPAKSGREKLPVLVYIFGGGFQNGDGSEPRYDGESMARKGIVAVSLNYRTNIFGFFAHPELTKESPHHASGNYGLLDQVAALQWVQKNIAAFGGDPKRVTIAGESAGSISVSALMASPLSKDLMAGAIGESGAAIASLPPRPLAEAEQNGVKFAAAAGADSLAALRAMTRAADPGSRRARHRASASARRWTATSCRRRCRRSRRPASRPRFRCWRARTPRSSAARACSAPASRRRKRSPAAIRKFYGDKADPVLKAYAATTTDEVFEAAMHLASARFISLRHVEMDRTAHEDQRQAGVPLSVRAGCVPPISGCRDSRRRRPAAPGGGAGSRAPAAGAPRRGPLRRNSVRDGQPRSRQTLCLGTGRLRSLQDDAGLLRELHQDGRPQRRRAADLAGLPAETNYQRMRIDVKSQAEPETHRDRYLALDAVIGR